MKIFGILLILLTGIFGGTLQVQKNHQQVEQISNFLLLLKRMETNISYNQISIIMLFKNLSSQKSFHHFLFLKDLNRFIEEHEDLKTAWNRALQLNSSYLSEEEIRLLAEFVDVLGNTDVKGQSENCNFYISRLEEKRKEALEKLKNKDKVTYAATLFLSILICIFLL